jgi:putative MATE family efflux protein
MANKNLDLLFGDYKVALRTMMVPMVLGMLITQSYNLIDGVWVSFLGPGALASLGVTMPLFMLLNGFANGMAAGGTSLIARFIGAKNHDKANQASTQAIILIIIISIILSIFVLIFQKPILLAIGGKGIITMAVQYNTIIFAGAIFIMLMAMLSGILRAEGDMNRSLYIMALSSVMNAIIDPILMFTFKMGIQGAALSTVISAIIPCIVLTYWIMVKKDTYSKIQKQYLKLNKKIVWALLIVGIPASMEMGCVAIQIGFVNTILSNVININAVATYTAGMRVVAFGMVPAIGLKLATVTVEGASYGGRKFLRLKNVFKYATKLGLIMGISIGAIIFIFAPQIVLLFTYSPQTAKLTPDIILMLRIMIIFFISQPLGTICSGYFQGIGKGPTSLATTFLQELICPIGFVSILVLISNANFALIVAAIVIGKLVGGLTSWIYSYYHCNKDLKKYGADGELITENDNFAI